MLKEKLTSQPVLKLPDLSKPFEIQCDACGDCCLGAVLLQEGHAIAYESRRLNANERVLGKYEKDLLAVLHDANQVIRQTNEVGKFPFAISFFFTLLKLPESTTK